MSKRHGEAKNPKLTNKINQNIEQIMAAKVVHK